MLVTHIPPAIRVPDVIERFRRYHAHPDNGAWGALHIVLEDGNVRDSDVQHCVEWAMESGDDEGAELARILLKMTKTQRGKIARLA